MRQMGHLLVCVLSILAHSWHRHMWRHGSSVVSRGSDMQITHSRPMSSDGLPPPTAYGGGGASGGGGGAGYGGAQYMDPAQLSHRAMEAQYPGGDPYQQQATYREQQATYREQEATYRAALEQCRCAVREVGW